MKYLIHLRSGATATACLAVLLLAQFSSGLRAQDSSKRLEFGLLTGNLHLRHEQRSGERPADWKSNSFNVFPYLSITGSRGRFLRLSTGPGVEVGYSSATSNNASPLNLYRETWDQQVNWYTSAIYGWEVRPFLSDLGERFCFRFGAGLQHTIAVSDKHYTLTSNFDTLTGNGVFEKHLWNNRGYQSLAAVGTAQVSFQVMKGLSLGLEWHSDVGISFGVTTNRTEHTEGGTGIATTIVVNRSKSQFSLEPNPRYVGYPALMIAWRL